jgi:hypothetical protein
VFSYRRSVTDAPDADVADLRAVGRDHLAHAIARVLVRRGRSSRDCGSFTEAFSLATEIAEQIEHLDWLVLRPNWQPKAGRQGR